MPIHERAIIDAHADIDPTADIGPNAVIEGEVRIGPETKVYPNAYIAGWVTIGANCQIHPGAVLGHVPQDFHYTGERTYLEVGDGTVIREFASIHCGTQPESKTIVGPNCTLLGYCHIGHNCVLGEGVTVMNAAGISGHIEIGDRAVISGYSVIHQFVRIGELAMIGGLSRVGMDVPPFMMVVHESECIGINAVGLRRRGFDKAVQLEIRQAHRHLYRSGKLFRQAVADLAEQVKTEPGRRLVAFLQSDSKRGFCGGPKSQARGSASSSDAEGGGES
jgi:UDP-N-acetylglucosamine acyltransferase